jgi:hypothetical protein
MIPHQFEDYGWDGQGPGEFPGHAPVAGADRRAPASPAPPVASLAYERAALAGLAVGGAWLVARSPAMRRLVWQLARVALTTWLPALVAREVRDAWREAGRQVEPTTAP